MYIVHKVGLENLWDDAVVKFWQKAKNLPFRSNYIQINQTISVETRLNRYVGVFQKTWNEINTMQFNSGCLLEGARVLKTLLHSKRKTFQESLQFPKPRVRKCPSSPCERFFPPQAMCVYAACAISLIRPSLIHIITLTCSSRTTLLMR